MKKFTVLALALLLVVAFTVPASALENTFGGYWRTRFYTQKDFSGNDSTKDLSRTDTRTRLYYTAKLNDNLKLVNKFEMDAVWGDTTVSTSNYGDAGADGIAVEVKHSYADFNVGSVNFKVGVQDFYLGRGFITDDDASGIKAIWKVNDGLYLPFIYLKNAEGGQGTAKNQEDVESYVFSPVIMLSKDIKINPYYAFLHSQDARSMPVNNAGLAGAFDNVNVNVVGLDFDAKMGAASLWFTGIYEFGTLTLEKALAATLPKGTELDLKAWLLAAGGKFDLGKADIHGQAFYATGEDKESVSGLLDKSIDGYFVTNSTTYYWSEILGCGIFDNQTPLVNGPYNPTGLGGGQNSSGGPVVTDLMAINLGTTFKPMDKLSITADLWWAKLAEDNDQGEDSLGIEADLKVTYQLVEGLTIDVVGAYLWAGDAITSNASSKNEYNPYEFGTRLSLSF